MEPPLTVVDTSVLVAALFKRGPKTMLRLWEDQSLRLCCSPAIFDEYRHILKKIPPIRKKAIELLDRIDQSDDVLWINAPKPVQVMIDDPADKKFIECAAAAGAHYIVSQDDHLLKIRVFEDVQIVRPSEFIRIIETRNHSPQI